MLFEIGRVTNKGRVANCQQTTGVMVMEVPIVVNPHLTLADDRYAEKMKDSYSFSFLM